MKCKSKTVFQTANKLVHVLASFTFFLQHITWLAGTEELRHDRNEYIR